MRAGRVLRLPTVIFVAWGLLIPSAHAGGGLSIGVHRVVDANGTLVGEYVPIYTGGVGAYTKLSGVRLTIPLAPAAPAAGLTYAAYGTILFTEPSCAGHAYIEPYFVGMGRPVLIMYRPGPLLYVADSMDPDPSVQYRSVMDSGQCSDQTGQNIGYLSTGTPVDLTARYKTPFQAR